MMVQKLWTEQPRCREQLTNRGLSELWKQQKVDPRDRRCRIANRATRMVYQLVGGRQLWRGRGVDREYLLAKLHEFHRLHQTPMDQTIRDLHEAFAWLPKSAYAAEAKPLADLARKQHRGPQRIGELLIPLLIRLGVGIEEKVESNTSEARSSNDWSCCQAHGYIVGYRSRHCRIEQARRKSVMLRQRFERRMRQCGAFELRISTRVARTNHSQLTEPCRQPSVARQRVPQKLPLRSCAHRARVFKNANSAMTVLFHQ
jgi:hypothetical protein